jgi:hypothetical protein
MVPGFLERSLTMEGQKGATWKEAVDKEEIL